MKTEKIQQILDKICTSDFTSSDVGLLFVWLRPAFSSDSVLLDISNFVAHSEGRDRGISFNHVNTFITNFIFVSEKGGTIFSLPPVFRRADVMQRLINVFHKLGLTLTENNFLSKTDKFISSLQEIMEETDFQFDDPRIVRCYVRRAGQGMQFCFQANLKGPRITMSGGGSVCSGLFD